MLRVKPTGNAIYGNNGYGPTFGGGHDIYIASGAGSSTSSYCNMGHTYVQLTGYRYGATESKNLLAGSYNFKPDELEVYYQTDLEGWLSVSASWECGLCAGWCSSKGHPFDFQAQKVHSPNLLEWNVQVR